MSQQIMLIKYIGMNEILAKPIGTVELIDTIL